MAAVETYEPTGTLKPVTDGLWIVDGPAIDFGYLGLKFPFPTRMTIVRLADGGLWVHSPTELSASLRGEVDALGRVRHLVAPNRIHYWWMEEWLAAYPGAPSKCRCEVVTLNVPVPKTLKVIKDLIPSDDAGVLSLSIDGKQVELGVPAMHPMLIQLLDYLRSRGLVPNIVASIEARLPQGYFDIEDLIDEADTLVDAGRVKSALGKQSEEAGQGHPIIGVLTNQTRPCEMRVG